MSTIATSGLCIATCRSRSLGVARLRQHVEAGLLEQANDALAEKHGVLGDDDAHRVSEHRNGVAQRWEVARQAVGEDLEDVLGIGKPREPVGAEVAHRHVRGDRVRRSRREDLPAVARQSRCAPPDGRRCPCSRPR